MATAKKAPAKKAKQPSLAAQLAASLGVTEAEATQRALQELAERIGLGAAKPEAKAAAKPKEAPVDHSGPSGLPKRLFLLLVGRGLDRGLPIEVIDVPCTLGTGRRNTIWINSPQIETKHLTIYETDGVWTLRDENTEHGTFFEGKRIKERTLKHGDEFELAGYLKLRAEFK
ncbi:MAG: FHA domain-containing protein [Deltaproteobacteria bacterium]|nr:FHA domain-containing protein [Deltaproteobacteria bacterium]